MFYSGNSSLHPTCLPMLTPIPVHDGEGLSDIYIVVGCLTPNEKSVAVGRLMAIFALEKIYLCVRVLLLLTMVTPLKSMGS